MIPMILMAPQSPWEDLSIDTSHILKQSIVAKILGRSTGNHHGTIYQITNILETAIIYALILGIRKALFILLRMSLEQRQGN